MAILAHEIVVVPKTLPSWRLYHAVDQISDGHRPKPLRHIPHRLREPHPIAHTGGGQRHCKVATLNKSSNGKANQYLPQAYILSRSNQAWGTCASEWPNLCCQASFTGRKFVGK